MNSIRPKRKIIKTSKEIHSPSPTKKRKINTSNTAHSHFGNNKNQQPLEEKFSFVEQNCEMISVTLDKIEEALQQNNHRLGLIDEQIDNFELQSLFLNEYTDETSFYSSSLQTASYPTPTLSDSLSSECANLPLENDISFSDVFIEDKTFCALPSKLEHQNSLPKIRAQRTGLTSIRIIKG